MLGNILEILSFNLTYEGEKGDLSLASLTLGAVFAVCMILLLIAKGMPTRELANKNNCACTYRVFTSFTPMKLERIAKTVYSVYLLLWLVDVTTTPIVEEGMNLILLLVMGAVFVADFLCIKNSKVNAVMAMGPVAATIPLTLFFAIFMEEITPQTLVDVMILAVFSWLGALVVSFDLGYAEQTVKYEEERKNRDCYGENLNQEAMERVLDARWAADRVFTLENPREIGEIEGMVVPYTDEKRPMTNRQYLENMAEALRWVPQMTEEEKVADHSLIPGENGYCGGALLADYSLKDYEPEAIVRVFQAIGYPEEPTPENYIRLRKTVELLCLLYEKRLKQLTERYQWVDRDCYRSLETGIVGESRVAKAVEELKKKYPNHEAIQGMEVLSNFNFPGATRRSVEIDNLILTPKGIYCVEVKNYGDGGDLPFYIDEKGKWYRNYNGTLYEVGGEDEEQRTPFEQNITQKEELEQKFAALLKTLSPDGTRIPEIQPLVVFANHSPLTNRSGYPVYSVEELEDLILSGTEEIKAEKIPKVAEELKGYRLADYSELRTDHAALTKRIVELKRLLARTQEIACGIKLSEKYRILK